MLTLQEVVFVRFNIESRKTRVYVYHKLRVHHVGTIEFRRFKEHQVAVYNFIKVTPPPPVCTVPPQLLPGVTCVLDISPCLSSHSHFVINVN
jgi:hypothetical protein